MSASEMRMAVEAAGEEPILQMSTKQKGLEDRGYCLYFLFSPHYVP